MVGKTPSYVEANTSCGNIMINHAHMTGDIRNIFPVPLMPKTSMNVNGPITIAEKLEIKEEPVHDAEMVYGTYDEATNCITIIYPEEKTMHITPKQQRRQRLQIESPQHSYDSMSPTSIHSDDTELSTLATNKLDYVQSDAGYESHGSPASSVSGTNHALTDLWHESFSELFPSLA